MTPRRFGVGVADSFSDEFEALGGTIADARRQRLRTPVDFTAHRSAPRSPTSTCVFFGGTQISGGGLLRKQLGQAGHARHPVPRS